MSNRLLPGILAAMQASRQTKDTELVRKITEKSKLKKIYWNRGTTGYTASVPGQMGDMTMVFSRPVDAPTDTWYHFTVRTWEGEVLKVENNTSGLNALAILAGRPDAAGASPLVAAVDELFSIVKDVGEGGVERALRQLDQI
ncbi:MAG: hypothetical protein WBQ09_11645 [Terriglobales bacterium]|jgi:hypothetical protein